MKNIRILLLLLPLLLFWGCEKREGYLDALHARYIPDSMTVKSVLRPEENADDARRVTFQIPWQSPVLQGVEGTNPRSYRIYMVETESGKAGGLSHSNSVWG